MQQVQESWLAHPHALSSVLSKLLDNSFISNAYSQCNKAFLGIPLHCS
uniref:Uncharacterized protein n=1 Tax=Arundo donax TaxID=35708 RepID=A0A0A8Z733_ARUDO